MNAGSILESWGVFIGDESNLIDARGVCGIVPHLGAHLAELCAIDEGNTDYVIDFPSLINLGKLLLLGRTLIFLRQLQVVIIIIVITSIFLYISYFETFN